MTDHKRAIITALRPSDCYHDWKCKYCGYVVKAVYPPMECPKCKKGGAE